MSIWSQPCLVPQAGLQEDPAPQQDGRLADAAVVLGAGHRVVQQVLLVTGRLLLLLLLLLPPQRQLWMCFQRRRRRRRQPPRKCVAVLLEALPLLLLLLPNLLLFQVNVRKGLVRRLLLLQHVLPTGDESPASAPVAITAGTGRRTAGKKEDQAHYFPKNNHLKKIPRAVCEQRPVAVGQRDYAPPAQSVVAVAAAAAYYVVVVVVD